MLVDNVERDNSARLHFGEVDGEGDGKVDLDFVLRRRTLYHEIGDSLRCGGITDLTSSREVGSFVTELVVLTSTWGHGFDFVVGRRVLLSRIHRVLSVVWESGLDYVV